MSGRVYSFGVPAGYRAGHYLRAPGSDAHVQWPFGSDAFVLGGVHIDGGFAPAVPDLPLWRQPQPQSLARLTHITDEWLVEWTVLGVWARSADNRGNCNANFIAEGHHDFDAMLAIACRHYPAEFDRISGAAPIRLASRRGGVPC